MMVLEKQLTDYIPGVFIYRSWKEEGKSLKDRIFDMSPYVMLEGVRFGCIPLSLLANFYTCVFPNREDLDFVEKSLTNLNSVLFYFSCTYFLKEENDVQ